MIRRRRAVSFVRSPSGGGASAFKGIEAIVIEKHDAANRSVRAIQLSGAKFLRIASRISSAGEPCADIRSANNAS